jgi:hypothetical protein
MLATAGTTWPCPSPCTGTEECNEDQGRPAARSGYLPPGQPGAGADRRQPNEKALEELRGELSTFVCEGQYADGVQRIIRSYLDSLGKTNQKAAWVSGFFGSGKSHLLKMLCHLWQDTAFPDGATARAIVPAMPDELRELLRELDTAGRRAGGLLAAAGRCPAEPPTRSGSRSWASCCAASACRSSTRRRASACGSIRRAGSTR